MFDVKYKCYGYTIVIMVEVFITITERMRMMKEFIRCRLVRDLNHLDTLYKDLSSKNSLLFLRLT